MDEPRTYIRKDGRRELAIEFEEWLDHSEDFYNLMQIYRHTPVGYQADTLKAFEAVKNALLREVTNLEEWIYV